jgi:hypothetical protein
VTAAESVVRVDAFRIVSSKRSLVPWMDLSGMR